MIGDLLRKANSDDATLATDASPALRLTGIIPASGRHHPVPLPEGVTPRSVQSDLHQLLEAHAEERRNGVYRLPSNRRQELLTILRAETSKGFLAGALGLGSGCGIEGVVWLALLSDSAATQFD